MEGVKVTVENFSSLIKALLEWECPIIVPYDVSGEEATEGEPVKKGGEAAHWVSIIGYYPDGGGDYVVFFNWGGFYTAKMQDFAVSNDQLSSNRYVSFDKYRFYKNGKIAVSDYYPSQEKYKNFSVMQKSNPEFNDPTSGGTTKDLLDDRGSRQRLLVGGLRNKVVVVFRKEDENDIASVLTGFDSHAVSPAV